MNAESNAEVDEAEAFAHQLAAIASVPRMRILAELAAGPLHVSELARRMSMSRALLYMHLTKLEESGYVSGELSLSPDGKAMKTFELVPFSIIVTPDVIQSIITTKESE